MQFIETKGTFLRSFPVFYTMVRYFDRKFLVGQDLPRYDDHLRFRDQYVPFHPGWWKWNMHATVEKVCCGGAR